MRLRLRQSLRQHRRRELEQQYNPINLDYIFDEDDPLAPWLEEREQPVFDANDTSWLDGGDGDGDGDGDGTDDDPLAGTSVAVPVRLRHDDDDDDDDDDDGDDYGGGGGDDDDDDGSGASPPGFGSGDAGGHDYFPTTGVNTPPYDQYGGGRGSGGASGGGASGSGGASGGGGHRRDKGKNIVEDTEQYDVGQIGGDMSSLYLQSHDYGHVHYPLPMPSQETQDSSASVDSSGYSMDYGNRYGDYRQLDMASQLATSLFGGNYDQYQHQSEQSEEYGYHQEPARKSFWW